MGPDKLREHFNSAEAHQYTYCKSCEIDFDSLEAQVEFKIKRRDLHPLICITCRLEWEGSFAEDKMNTHFQTAEIHRDTYCHECHRNFASANNLREVKVIVRVSESKWLTEI